MTRGDESRRSGDRWTLVYFALLPVVAPIGFLAFGSLRRLKSLPPLWRWLLGAFVLSQVTAAFFSPHPLASVPLALGRAGLTTALILTGFLVGRTGPVRWALFGIAVVALTAFGTSVFSVSGHPLLHRLSHPYYTAVSLGLIAMMGLLLAVTWTDGPRLWRVVGGALALGMFLWSGSRGPLLALFVGLLAMGPAGLARHWKAVLLAVVGTLGITVALQLKSPDAITSRFLDNTLNGRGSFWYDAIGAARQSPLGGAGPYQLGPYLLTQYSGGCELRDQVSQTATNTCPALLYALRGSWLIAHNTAFHLLGETGIIGLGGWLMLMGTLAVAAWRSRNPLINSVTWATAAMGLVDNPTLLPSLGYAELYWVLSGVGVALYSQQPAPAHRTSVVPAAALVATLMLTYLTLPLWLDELRPRSAAGLRLQAVTVPDRLTAHERVTFFIEADVPAGYYHIRGVVCPVVRLSPCLNVAHNVMHGPASGLWTPVSLDPLPAGRYTLWLSVFDAEDRVQLRVERPLTQWRGELEVLTEP